MANRPVKYRFVNLLYTVLHIKYHTPVWPFLIRGSQILNFLELIYIINSLLCLSVCPPCYGRLNGWADFKNILHVDYPWVGDGYRPKIFLIGQKKIFFRKFYDFSFQNSQKNSCQKFFLKKIWEKQICSWVSEASHVYLE